MGCSFYLLPRLLKPGMIYSTASLTNMHHLLLGGLREFVSLNGLLGISKMRLTKETISLKKARKTNNAGDRTAFREIHLAIR